MTTACPVCRTEYAVTPADVGRRIACARCGTHLTVDESGLRADSPLPSVGEGPGVRGNPPTAPGASPQGSHSAAPHPPAPSPTGGRGGERPAAVPGRSVTESVSGLWANADWATVLFLAGVLLVLWFVMMPAVATAYVERRTAQLSEETLDHAVYLRKLRDREADPKQVSDAEEAWQKRREELQERVRYAETARGRTAYYDRYGLLLGYLLLAAGAVGWTRAGQPLVRRIVGGVVLTLQLLLAFQTVTPVGCSSPPRAYNSAAAPAP